MKDYYKILNVTRSDNAITIKKTYRKLALDLHPDINKSPDAHDKFIELNEAYQVLNDYNKRRQYDRLYDYQILNYLPKKKATYERNHNAWETNVNNSAKKGRNRGKKYASENGRKFKRRVDWWGTWIIFDIIIEFIWLIIKGIISII